MKKIELRRPKTGFTLMELMIGVALFSFALFGMMALLGETLAMGKFSEGRLIAMNEARRVIEAIRREADTNVNGLAGTANTINQTNWTQGGNTLTNKAVTGTDTNDNRLPNNDDLLPVRAKGSWTVKGKGKP